MEAQEVFDQVVLHLYHQGKPAIGPNGCVYRGEGGISCAVGCLIPDEKYNPRIEGISIGESLENKYAGYVKSPRGQTLQNILEDLGLWEHASLLMELQGAHDMWDMELGFGWEEVLEQLRKIAKDFGLTFPELPSKK